ncbi:geranylgeranyl pyrophosphate synthetase [Stemphylium lycopersici]|nr:geranylgeranyl pyrophosphate synthetase [Stemphylium lycopersici]
MQQSVCICLPASSGEPWMALDELEPMRRRPPQWTPLQTPRRLDEDSGRYFRDPNAAKFPEYPMVSVVRAILEAQPEYPTEDIDLFACGSTLGNLLRFARGIDKAFRFTIEIIQNTIFFVRKENDPREIIEGIHGFGHTFPEAYTTWEQDVKGSDSHQRIVRYKFGGLECLVRFESDGYIKGPSTNRDRSGKSIPEEEDLAQALQDVTVSTSSAVKCGTPNDLILKQGGSEVPQGSIFDLKTRSGKYKKDIDMGDIYPQLWLKQIPNFIVAYHDGAGLFQDIRVQDVKDGVRGWTKDNVDGIRRFAELLNKIMGVAKNSQESVLDVYCPGADRLEIREPCGIAPSALPTELKSCWKGKGAHAPLTHEEFVALADDVEHRSNGSDDDFEYSSDHKPEYTFDVDSDDEPDYTACSAHDCGYCGKCSY